MIITIIRARRTKIIQNNNSTICVVIKNLNNHSNNNHKIKVIDEKRRINAIK